MSLVAMGCQTMHAGMMVFISGTDISYILRMDLQIQIHYYYKYCPCCHNCFSHGRIISVLLGIVYVLLWVIHKALKHDVTPILIVLLLRTGYALSFWAQCKCYITVNMWITMLNKLVICNCKKWLFWCAYGSVHFFQRISQSEQHSDFRWPTHPPP